MRVVWLGMKECPWGGGGGLIGGNLGCYQYIFYEIGVFMKSSEAGKNTTGLGSKK